MSRSWRLFLQDMLQAVRKIERFTEERDLAAFVADEMVYDATLRNLEVLGEATKGIPEVVRVRHQQIDWRGIAGLRDILAHAYLALDDATLWDIIQHKIPLLRQQLEHIDEEG